MQITIKTKNLELTSSLENLVKKRMSGTKKMIDAFQASTNVIVELKKETKHHRKGDIYVAEAIVGLPGKKLVARSHGENLLKAITTMRNDLLRELKKYKTKTVELPRRKYRKVKR